MKYLFLLCLLFSVGCANQEMVARHLQNVSVSIQVEDGTGSGTVFSVGDSCYVLTAAHVIACNVTSKKVNGVEVVYFKDPSIYSEFVYKGRVVSRTLSSAKVIKFSSASVGHDIAILKLDQGDFCSDNFVKFPTTGHGYDVGTTVYHIGSFRGLGGYNSFSTGVISYTGRLRGDFEYDQTSCTALSGSSGGGVFLIDGTYIGMLTRGCGETSNLIVPARRILRWARENNLAWIFDRSLPIPSEEELSQMTVFDDATKFILSVK